MNIELDKPALIVPAGKFPHTNGDQLLDGKALKRILARMIDWDRDIVVDYQHESMKQCGRAPAAGWVKKDTAKITNEGITATIEWTDEGRELVESKKYRFLSPVFERVNGEIVGLINLGLTNNPNINAAKPLINQLPNQENFMNEDLITKLKEALGLEPDAEDEAALEAVTELINLASLYSQLGEAAVALGLTPEDDDDTVIARIMELAQRSCDSVEKEIDTLVNDAITAGTIRPAQKQWARGYALSNPGSFRQFLANAGPAAPMGGLITQTAQDQAVNKISESEADICRLLGISENDYLTHGS